jgi:hypothetical protein
MKYIAFTVLILLAIVCLLYAVLYCADPEGRGGSMILACLAGFIAFLGGAITVAVKY